VSGIVYGGFDQIYNLYNPLVYDKADILETYLFRNGVIGGDYSLGTAMGLFNSVVAFILVILANKVIRNWGARVYGDDPYREEGSVEDVAAEDFRQNPGKYCFQCAALSLFHRLCRTDAVSVFVCGAGIHEEC